MFVSHFNSITNSASKKTILVTQCDRIQSSSRLVNLHRKFTRCCSITYIMLCAVYGVALVEFTTISRRICFETVNTLLQIASVYICRAIELHTISHIANTAQSMCGYIVLCVS